MPSARETLFIHHSHVFLRAFQKQEGYPESIAPAPSGDYGAPPAQPGSEYGVPN